MISSGINLRQARLLSDAYEVGPPDFDDFSGNPHLNFKSEVADSYVTPTAGAIQNLFDHFYNSIGRKR